MSYVRSKMINGHGPYYYRVESVRNGDRVQQRYIAYLGKTGASGTSGTGPETVSPIAEKKELGTTESQSSKIETKPESEKTVPKKEIERNEEKMHTEQEKSKELGTTEPDKDYDYYESRTYNIQGKPFDTETFNELKKGGHIYYQSAADLEDQGHYGAKTGWKVRVTPESAKIMRKAGKSVGDKSAFERKQERKKEEERKKAESYVLDPWR